MVIGIKETNYLDNPLLKDDLLSKHPVNRNKEPLNNPLPKYYLAKKLVNNPLPKYYLAKGLVNNLNYIY